MEKRLEPDYNIFATRYTLYNRKYNTYVKELAELTRRVLDVVAPVLGLDPKEVVVTLKPIRVNFGETHQNTAQEVYIYMDPRLKRGPIRDMSRRSWFVRSLCHELVHVQQQMQGRLTYNKLCWASKLPLVGVWEGVFYAGKSYREYRNFPWEVEAWGLMDDLAEMYFASKIGKKDRWMNKKG